MIAERYELEERVGAGGMGVVWRALDRDLGRPVALKQSHAGDNGQIRREARIGAGLHHPNIVTVFDVVVDADERWLVMEYLPSRSLSEVVAADGPVHPRLAARIGVQLASALAAMHAKGMVHRDVKPGNVLVTDDGTAKLSDLGIARWSEVTRTGGGEIAGTPGYLAPEVADGREALAAADVFALGATLFAATTGGSPWGSSGPSVQFRRALAFELEQVEGELAPVLGELMRRQPAARPAAQRAAELLGEIIGETPPVAVRRRSRRGLVIGAAAAVALLVAGAAVYAVASRPDYIGDAATMDPCALLDPAALRRYTELPVEIVRDHEFFNRCDLWVPLGAGENDAVRVELKVQQPALFGELPPRPDDVETKRYPLGDGKCSTDLLLPDGNFVQITSSHVDAKPVDLCGMTSDVSNEAQRVLMKNHEIPRRQQPYPSQSLAHVDACALLRGPDIFKAVGAEVPAYPEMGGWGCSWDTGRREVTIEFMREPPLDPARNGRRITAGDREAYVKAGIENWPDACSARIVHRRYQDTPPMIESLRVYLEEDKIADPGTLCDGAAALAQAVAGRLPAP